MRTKILGLLAVGLLAGPMSANALVITISGQGAADGQWDITTTAPGQFDDLLPTLDDQVGGASQALAAEFALALGFGLGTPNGSSGNLDRCSLMRTVIPVLTTLACSSKVPARWAAGLRRSLIQSFSLLRVASLRSPSPAGSRYSASVFSVSVRTAQAA
jgi:hypothetical protein